MNDGDVEVVIIGALDTSIPALVHVREAIQYSDENKYPDATIGQGKWCFSVGDHREFWSGVKVIGTNDDL